MDVQCTLWSTQWTLAGGCTVYIVQYGVYIVQCTLYITQCALSGGCTPAVVVSRPRFSRNIYSLSRLVSLMITDSKVLFLIQAFYQEKCYSYFSPPEAVAIFQHFISLNLNLLKDFQAEISL